MKYKDEISNILAKVRNEIKSVEIELSSVPDGHITQEVHNGKDTLVIVRYPDGKRIRRSVKTDSADAYVFLRKKALLQRLDELKRNERVLAAAQLKLKDTSMYNRLAEFESEFTVVPEEMMIKVLSVNREASEWETQPYEKLDYKSEMKRHITGTGLCVRSKSELLIAEMLYDYNIAFRYEQTLHFGNISFHPDFTIMRSDGKIFYWEHQGLTNSKEYLDHQAQKLQIYISNNITPWDNLIVTYDNASGDIDTRIIRFEIENRLL